MNVYLYLKHQSDHSIIGLSTNRGFMSFSVCLKREQIHLCSSGDCSEADSKSKAVISCLELTFHSGVFVSLSTKSGGKQKNNPKTRPHEDRD